MRENIVQEENEMRKRIMSLLLCIVLMLSLIPTVAFAGDDPTVIESIAIEGVVAPVAGATPNTNFTVATEGVHKQTIGYWFNVTDSDWQNSTPFEGGKTYSFFAPVDYDSGYSWKDDFTETAVTMNGTDNVIASKSAGAPTQYRVRGEFICPFPEITGITVTGVQAPEYGKPCSTSGITVSADPADSVSCYVSWLKQDRSSGGEFWSDGHDWGFMEDGETFEEGTYRLRVVITRKDGYQYSDGVAGKINGEAVDVYYGALGSMRVMSSKTFTVDAPAPTEITAVTISGLTVPAAGDDIAAWLSDITYSNAEAYKYITPQVFEGTHGDSEYTGVSEGVFRADKEYFFYVELWPKDGYVFDKDKLTVSMADISEMGHNFRSGGAELDVASEYFTPTAPAPVTTGSITLTKTFSGLDPDDCPINTATFTVTGSDGKVYGPVKVGSREFTSPTPAAGQYVWKLDNLSAGNYTITETAYDVEGYSCTVTYQVGTGDARKGASTTVALDGDDLMISVTDAYEKEEPTKPTEPEKPTKPTKPTKPAKPAGPTSPNTADSSQMFLWIALLFISIGAVAGSTIFTKKRIYNK